MLEKLSGEYLSLLIAVQEDPLGTIELLAKRTGTSKPTAAKRLRELQAKRVFSVKPLLDYHSLGFEAVDLLAETDSLDGIIRIEGIAKKHPYTTYRARYYGSTNGVFMQFRIPVGSKEYLIQLLDELEKEKSITGYQLLPSDSVSAIYTPMRLKGWDAKTMRWTFDWDKWFKIKARKKVIKKRDEPPGKVLSWFTKKDAHIISQLMHGARRKNVEIVDAIKKKGIAITPQTFSRRHQVIKDECFDGYRVSFDREIFDIYNSVLLVGKAEEELLASIGTKLRTDPIPFESTYRAIGEHLFWTIRLQSSHLSSLLANLYSTLDEMRVFIMDYDHSYLYFLWPETFSDETKSWRVDSKFMVDDVLGK